MIDQKAQFLFEFLQERREKYFSIALRVLRSNSADEAEEIVQRTNVEVIEKKEDYYASEKREFRIWREIESKAKYKSRTRGKFVYSDEESAIEFIVQKSYSVAEIRTPDEELEQKELLEFIDNCLQRMGYPFKEVFERFVLHGFSYNELSESSNISIGNLKVIKYRANKKLIECLYRIYGDDIFSS